MLLHTQMKQTTNLKNKGIQWTFGGDGCACYLDSQVYAYVQTHQILYIRYVQGFVYQLNTYKEI